MDRHEHRPRSVAAAGYICAWALRRRQCVARADGVLPTMAACWTARSLQLSHCLVAQHLGRSFRAFSDPRSWRSGIAPGVSVEFECKTGLVGTYFISIHLGRDCRLVGSSDGTISSSKWSDAASRLSIAYKHPLDSGGTHHGLRDHIFLHAD